MAGQVALDVDPVTTNPTAHVGDRVRLVVIHGKYTHLEPGTTGTERFVDDWATVHVSWDNGIRLGLVAGDGDRFELLS